MAQLFKNVYNSDIGTTFTNVYECSSAVSSSIIVSMTISNKLLNEVKVSVRVVDSINIVTAYLIYNSKLSVGSSLALAGNVQKIILKTGDKIEINSSEDASIDVNMSIIENNEAFECCIPIEWFGDIGIYSCGDLDQDRMEMFDLTTDGLGTFWANSNTTSYYRTGVSNRSIGLIAGGWSYLTAVDNFAFSTQANATHYADLYEGTSHYGGASNGSIALFGSGYDNITTIQKIGFVSSENGTFWGDLDVGRYGKTAVSSGTQAIFAGGITVTTIESVDYSSESNAAFYGSLTDSRGILPASSNKTIGIFFPGSNGTSALDYIEFASGGNAVGFGNLPQSNYAQGATGNDTKSIVMGGEYNAGAYTVEYATLAGATNIGDGFNYDGGSPASSSGN